MVRCLIITTCSLAVALIISSAIVIAETIIDSKQPLITYRLYNTFNLMSPIYCVGLHVLSTDQLHFSV